MEQDLITLICKALPELRLLAEGAVLRFESELASLNIQGEAAVALNDVGTALCLMRAQIAQLQAALK